MKLWLFLLFLCCGSPGMEIGGRGELLGAPVEGP